MNGKLCLDCIFYVAKKSQASLGMCGYPLPEWLKIGASGGGYVNGHEATNCATFKNRMDVMQEQIK